MCIFFICYSSEPESSKVAENLGVTEPEELSVIRGSEQNSEAESEENTTGYTPKMKKISDNDSLESDISFEHHSTHDSSGNQENVNTTEYLSNLLRQDTVGNLATLKSDTEDLTHRLLSLIHTSSDADAMVTVKHHLKSSISIMESKKHYSAIGNKENFDPTTRIPANANHKNRPGFSLPKKRKPSCKTVSKPTASEQKKMKLFMGTTSIKVCGICCDTSTEMEVNWIACDNCGLWIHVACKQSQSENDDTFLCNNCITCM